LIIEAAKQENKQNKPVLKEATEFGVDSVALGSSHKPSFDLHRNYIHKHIVTYDTNL
jgi:hypothetical protein